MNVDIKNVCKAIINVKEKMEWRVLSHPEETYEEESKIFDIINRLAKEKGQKLSHYVSSQKDLLQVCKALESIRDEIDIDYTVIFDILCQLAQEKNQTVVEYINSENEDASTLEKWSTVVGEAGRLYLTKEQVRKMNELRPKNEAPVFTIIRNEDRNTAMIASFDIKADSDNADKSQRQYDTSYAGTMQIGLGSLFSPGEEVVCRMLENGVITVCKDQ